MLGEKPLERKNKMKHAGTQTIKTERLTLRRFEITDAEKMFCNWTNDNEVTKYMRWNAHKDVDETNGILQQWVEDYSKESSYLWGICLNDCGELIGSIGAFITEVDYKADVGYCIGQKWWGKGYASEALRGLIDYMFEKTDIERIGAYHAVENIASGKVMENAGMVKEGFARKYFKGINGFYDSNMYGIIREMWENPVPLQAPVYDIS